MMTNANSGILSSTAKACPAFCDCDFPNSITVSNCKDNIPDMIQCRCGEDESHAMHWQWHCGLTDAIITGPSITFHPTFSQGTTVVRGEKPLKTGMVHFWEIRVLTCLAGTDVMIGIGTDKFDIDAFKFLFASALGSDSQSWGFSYNGKIQHNGIMQPYGQIFSQGVIVGVYLDRTLGYLEFFLNRRSLGVAYNNIPTDPNVNIYPMVCATAAKTAMRLINSTSTAECLQLRAFKSLSKQPKALREIRQMPGLVAVSKLYWFLAPPVRFSQRSAENEYDIADEAVLSKARLNRKQKFNDEDPDINDLYTNAHKIAIHRRASEEEYFISEYCDEYFHYLL